jgi:hypothetical protein
MKFAPAAKKFFGLKENQTLADFAAEIRRLTPEDRTELKAGLEAILGIIIEEDSPNPNPQTQ